MMSERREWFIEQDELRHPDATAFAFTSDPNNDLVHVREVLPGDDDWKRRYEAVQHTPYEQLATKHAALVKAAKIKDAKIKALESTIELLRKGMVESCRDDRYEVMGGCVYVAELTKAARAVLADYDDNCSIAEFNNSIDALNKSLENEDE